MLAWHCDGPGCTTWQRRITALSTDSWIAITDTTLHFCCWDCLMRYCAERTPTEEVRRR